MIIKFNFKSMHGLVVNATDMLEYKPAIPKEKGLYVIWNKVNLSRGCYIGTSADLKERFASRLMAINHMGFVQEIDQIKIYIVKTQVNGASILPGDDGKISLTIGSKFFDVDVEKLLMRYYINNDTRIRNTNKWDYYHNNSGEEQTLTMDCSGVGEITAFKEITIRNNSLY